MLCSKQLWFMLLIKTNLACKFIRELIVYFYKNWFCSCNMNLYILSGVIVLDLNLPESLHTELKWESIRVA